MIAVVALAIGSVCGIAWSKSFSLSVQEGESFCTQISIYRYGILVSRQTILTRGGQVAQSELSGNPRGGALRLKLRVAPARMQGQEQQAHVMTTIHEKLGDSWTVLNDSDYLVTIDQETSVYRDSPLGPLELHILVSPGPLSLIRESQVVELAEPARP
ncbi:hypothetical protein [Arenimonas oryziterrae]|uniref:Uncharacterized protein n=1 Tax=Arenimonas oryziterrae DSM 21050 = YC6267 TaxID=1121015 RepID=A0A091BJI6_9GAMM|nr:hypothetical protein [Arenimonas oryziterrae]KFN44480.1 hypothetical protein N789_00300 [Arenimonas oryziterrae DSM 21050 = YC6267]